MLDWKQSAKGKGKSGVLGFQGAQADVRLELGLPNQWTATEVDDVSSVRACRGGVMRVLLTMKRTKVGVDVEVERELACGSNDHAFITRPCKIRNNPLDCDGMGLFGLGVEVADLANGEGNVGSTVAGEVEEHSNDGGIAPGLLPSGSEPRVC